MWFDDPRRARAGASPRALTAAFAAMLIVGCGSSEAAEDTESEPVPAGAEPAASPATQPEPPAERAPTSDPSATAASPEPARPAATPPAAPAPTRPAEPEPEPEPTLVIPAETSLLLETDETISTKDHGVGDTFGLTIMQNVLDADGRILLPAGSKATGLITEAAESTGSDRPAVLRFTVAHVVYEGTPVELTGEIVEAEIQGDSRTSGERTAAIIAGGAAAGALVGRVAGGGARDAVVGAVAGAAAGTAYWLVTRDGHAELPEGSTLTFFLNEPVVIR